MPTQQAIAEHLDLDQSAVSRWMAELRLDWAALSMDEIRIVYIRRIREQAAGRATSGDLDLATERARLAREQADRVAMLNARQRRELAPVAVIETVLARVGRQIAGILEALPVQLRRRAANLTTEDIEFLQAEIDKARNVATRIEIDLEELNGPAGDPESDPLRAEAA